MVEKKKIYYCFKKGSKTPDLIYYKEPPQSVKKLMKVYEVDLSKIEVEKEGHSTIVKRSEDDNLIFEFHKKPERKIEEKEEKIPEPEEEDKNMVELTPELLELLEEFRLSREGK